MCSFQGNIDAEISVTPSQNNDEAKSYFVKIWSTKNWPPFRHSSGRAAETNGYSLRMFC